MLTNDSAETALWISYRRRPLTLRGFSEAVARRTASEFGRAWRPHSFRKSVARATSVADATVLLGDTPHVVQKDYAPARRAEALRRHLDLLEQQASEKAACSGSETSTNSALRAVTEGSPVAVPDT